MSVMRRSLTPPSIDPPSSSSIAPSSSVLSVESSIRVPIGSTLKIAAVEFDGTGAVRVRPRQLRGGQDLHLQRHAQLGRQAGRGGAAEGVERAVQPPLLLGGELGRAREVDRAHAAAPLRRGLLLGQAALTGRVHQGRDRVRAEDGAAHATASMAGDEHAVGAAGLAHGHLARCPRRRGSCGRGRRRSRWPRSGSGAAESWSRTAASLRWPTSREAEDTVNILAPPTRTASSIGRRPPAATTRSMSSGTATSANLNDPGAACPPLEGSTTWASPATPSPAVQERQADARAQPEGHEDIAGDGRGGELTHPDHRLRHRYRPNRASS